MEVADKTHALLSPSGAHRWGRCAGSVVLEQQFEDRGSSYARWGTCAHEVAALILAEAVLLTTEGPTWLPANAESFVGRVFQIEGYDVEFDMEMADCVNDYVATVEGYWEPGDIMLVEQAVPLQHITGEKDATGTADCIIIKPRLEKIIVIDLKGGQGVMVDAEHNEQGVMYADGAIAEHGWLYGPFKQVMIVIIQPRLHHVSEWDIELETLAGEIEKLRAAARDCDRALQLGLGVQQQAIPVEHLRETLNPGEKQCKFCSAKSICPALQGEVSTALSLTAPPARAEEFPDLSIGKQAAAADPTVATPEQLAKAWKAIPLIEQWVEAIRNAVHAELHEGREVGDLCLYEGKQGSRGWSDEAQAEKLMKSSRVKADEMYTKKLISYPAAEKAFKGKPTVWSKLAPLVTRPDGKPVVGVKGDTKRIPWSPCAPEEFPDLDAEDELFS